MLKEQTRKKAAQKKIYLRCNKCLTRLMCTNSTRTAFTSKSNRCNASNVLFSFNVYRNRHRWLARSSCSPPCVSGSLYWSRHILEICVFKKLIMNLIVLKSSKVKASEFALYKKYQLKLSSKNMHSFISSESVRYFQVQNIR